MHLPGRTARTQILAQNWIAPVTEISICTSQDYNQILDQLHDFWGARDMRHLHHPFLIHEFGSSAFVARSGDQVLGYLFGFISQTRPVGYVHAIAVRISARRQHIGQQLFERFVEFARQHACKHVKAITTPANAASIAFHKNLGMQLLGEPNAGGDSHRSRLCRPGRLAGSILDAHLKFAGATILSIFLLDCCALLAWRSAKW